MQDRCLFLKTWVSSNVSYVKDLINDHGELMSDEEIYDTIDNKHNIYAEIVIIKKYILKRIRGVDCSIAPFVKIPNNVLMLGNNKWHNVVGKKCKFFYSLMSQKSGSKPHMQSIYSRNFLFQNTHSM